jgi:hypothetical protein
VADSLPHLKAALAGRYSIERELGRGGMATVYLARDLKHDWDAAEQLIDSAMALRRHDQRDFALRLHARLGLDDTAGARADLDTVSLMARMHGPSTPTASACDATLHILVDARFGDTTAAARRLAALEQRFPAPATQSRNVQLCLAAARIAVGGGACARGLALLARIPDLRRDALRDPLWDPQ